MYKFRRPIEVTSHLSKKVLSVRCVLLSLTARDTLLLQLFKGYFLNVSNRMCTVLSFLAKKLRCVNMTYVNVVDRNLQQQQCSKVQRTPVICSGVTYSHSFSLFFNMNKIKLDTLLLHLFKGYFFILP